MSVRFFGRLHELAGRRAWALDLPERSTVRDVWREAATAFPDLVALERAISSAVNAEFANSGVEVRDGDEIAFLPPVSGGSH